MEVSEGTSQSQMTNGNPQYNNQPRKGGPSVKPGSLRVLHVTFNMGIGGTEQVIRQLVSGMEGSNVANEIVCIDGAIGPVGEALKAVGIPISSVKRGAGIDRGTIVDLRCIIRQGDFDIVHCHQYTPFFYGRMAAFGTNAKVVFTEHGRFHPDRYRWKAMPVNRFLGLVTPGIVAISEATRQALSRYEFIPKKRIKVIYNGIRTIEADPEGARTIRESLGIPLDHLVMGTVARLDPVKNQPLMLRSFARVLDEHPDCWLLMVGDGPDRASLELLSRDLGIEQRVLFVGFQNEPANYLAAMDIFLLSSHTEGTSMTLLEAMCLGLPSVVTEVGGNPEIITHEKTGLLSPTENVDQFTRNISRLLNDSSLNQAIRRNCRQEFAQRFSVGGMVRAYGDLYAKVAGESA